MNQDIQAVMHRVLFAKRIVVARCGKYADPKKQAQFDLYDDGYWYKTDGRRAFLPRDTLDALTTTISLMYEAAPARPLEVFLWLGGDQFFVHPVARESVQYLVQCPSICGGVFRCEFERGHQGQHEARGVGVDERFSW